MSTMANDDIFWTIEGYSKLSKEMGVSVESPIYHYTRGTLRIDWQLVFYPGGAGEMSSRDNSFDYCDTYYYDSVSLFLKMVRCNNTSIRAKFRTWFSDNNGKQWGNCDCNNGAQFHNLQKHRTWGWCDMITTTLFERVLSEDKVLRVHCEIYTVEVTGEPLNIFTSVETACMHQYWSLYEQRKFTDMVISVGNKEFPVHKLVLAARSPVIMAMFDHEMKENQQNRLEISDFDAETVEKMIKSLYTGDCGDPGDKAAELLACAEKYDVKELKTECEVALARELDAHNVLAVLQLADVHRAQHLKKFAMEFIKDNIENVMTSPGWNSLSHSSLVDDFIKSLFPEKFVNPSISN